VEYGVWYRGRFWPVIAGGSGEGDGGLEGGTVADLTAQLAAAQARVGELEAAAGAAEGLRGRADQLAADLQTVQVERDAHAARVAELEAAHGQAVSRGLDAHRRALIAENAGQIVEELVQGATEEALDASVELARGAFSRLSEGIRLQIAGERVPAGGGGRTEPDVERLSPLQKIAHGLGRK
jgi:hypothetical protein